MRRLLAITAALAGAAAAVLAMAPSPGESPLFSRKAPPPPRVRAELAWEIVLPEAPDGELLVVDPAGAPAPPGSCGPCAPGEPAAASEPPRASADRLLVLVPLPGAVEARRPADGSLAWRAEGFDGKGLAAAAPVASPRGPALAWAGAGEAGAGAFALLALADGAPVVRRSLDGVPAGPPLPLPGASPPRWLVPLEGGAVELLDAAGRPLERTVLPGEVHPPLLLVAGWPAAIVGKARRLLPVGRPAPRRAPERFDPRAVAACAEGGLFTARGREVTRWRCRRLRRGGFRCRRRWTQVLGGKVLAPPLVLGETLVVGSLDTHVYAFLRRNGHLLWRRSVGHRVASPVLRLGSDQGDLLVVLPEATPEARFLRASDGEPAGTLAGPGEAVFLRGGALAGHRLLVPVRPPPYRETRLACWEIRILPPEPGNGRGKGAGNLAPAGEQP